jgi:hypothetical protein
LVIGKVLSYMAFRSLKYSYVDKENMRGNQCGPGPETMLFSWQICGFAIWTGTPRKFVDLRFAG